MVPLLLGLGLSVEQVAQRLGLDVETRVNISAVVSNLTSLNTQRERKFLALMVKKIHD